MTAATTPIAISQLGQIAINVHDVNRAKAFYRDILGLPLLFTAGSLAFFDCGGVRLMLTHPEKPEFDHPSSVLYFAVPDIAAAHRQMLSSSVRFEDEPHLIAKMPDHDLWMAFFRDSEENLLAHSENRIGPAPGFKSGREGRNFQSGLHRLETSVSKKRPPLDNCSARLKRRVLPDSNASRQFP